MGSDDAFSNGNLRAFQEPSSSASEMIWNPITKIISFQSSAVSAAKVGCRQHVQHGALPPQLRQQARAADVSQPRVIGWQVETRSPAWLLRALPPRFELQERIPGAEIGTVDKFQGREAPIVIYSMATSTHADAPRGMEFLYSANRLNVAVSRAKCVCIVVASPHLFEPDCRTPRQMQLANAFCRYAEMASVL